MKAIRSDYEMRDPDIWGISREDHEEILQRKGTGLEEVYRLYDYALRNQIEVSWENVIHQTIPEGSVVGTKFQSNPLDFYYGEESRASSNQQSSGIRNPETHVPEFSCK